MRTVRFGTLIQFPGGGFLTVHARKDNSSPVWQLQVTAVRNQVFIEPIHTADVEVKMTSLSGVVSVLTSGKPSSFMVIHNQECYLYNIPDALIQTSEVVVSIAGSVYPISLSEEKQIP